MYDIRKAAPRWEGTFWTFAKVSDSERSNKLLYEIHPGSVHLLHEPWVGGVMLWTGQWREKEREKGEDGEGKRWRDSGVGMWCGWREDCSHPERHNAAISLHELDKDRSSFLRQGHLNLWANRSENEIVLGLREKKERNIWPLLPKSYIRGAMSYVCSESWGVNKLWTFWKFFMSILHVLFCFTFNKESSNTDSEVEVGG